MTKTAVITLAFFATLFSNNLYAEGGRYQIEVLVFSQSLPTTETFTQTESKIQWPTALTELSAYQPADNKSLKETASALFKEAAYQAIAHFAWVQSVGLGNVILPVHLQSEDGKLDGYVQLRNAQPFELTVDIEQKSNLAGSTGKLYLYRVNEKRAVKLNDLHYFDHPKIGVLVRVSGG